MLPNKTVFKYYIIGLGKKEREKNALLVLVIYIMIL